MAVSPFEIDVVDTVSPCIDAGEHGAVSIDAKHHLATANCKGPTKTTEIAVNSFQVEVDRIRRRISAPYSVGDASVLLNGEPTV